MTKTTANSQKGQQNSQQGLFFDNGGLPSNQTNAFSNCTLNRSASLHIKEKLESLFSVKLERALIISVVELWGGKEGGGNQA